MKKYYKDIDGERIWLGKNLNHDGRLIINPTEEQILAAGYVEYISEVSNPTEGQILENLRRGKIAQLHAYDESEEVNVCHISRDGVTMDYWADKHERDSLKSALRDCIMLGRTEYRLDIRELGVSMEVNCEMLLQMMAALEVYAVDCYNKTTDHEFALKSCETKEELEAYDFTQGYPDKLTFEF